ncbi:sushi, von Willebrand factor type A, EGF and pentraxin domain-containing protein 1-like [Watersipora subatra]|uniref:sushi, von Willebrand factor type A, EGF and pentraxin domain-containing protein 1-like n=1 Tax=Watersipora subatra TaxID=2589382 RepID=UPI00355B7736
MPNIAKIVDRKNKRTLSNKESPPPSKEYNCRQPAQCPLNGKCLESSFIYQCNYTDSTGRSNELRSTGTYEIQGNEVHLTFTTDGSVTYSGWSIRWSALVTCTAGQSECGVDAECTNTSGSYTCRCNEGYDGDGLTCLGKDCGSPILSGVTCSGNQTRYPNTVSCDCLPGYERANSQFNLTCGNTGVWSMPSDNITAVCTRVNCGTPPVVAYSNAQATYRTGTEYQDRVTFSCISGYEISTEPNYVVCLANRTWSRPPVCTKVNCGPPPDVRNIDNQTTVQNGTRFGDQVTYTCLSGYEMFTEFSSVECLADGRWSGTPRCTTKDCGPVPPATGINCTSSSTRYPSIATCSCNTGYERFNQQYTVNCQTSGTWSSSQDDHPPRCEKVDCGIPPVVDNSESQTSVQTGTKYGDRVTYMCLQGYEDEHNLTSITCQATGQWSTAPTCLRVSCGTPPTIQHMDTQATVQSGTKYEDTVEYYCLPGYLVQSGTRSIQCQSTKQWTEPPSCTKVDCGTPPEVENGALNRLQYNTTLDSKVTYKCDGHQYNMIGSATVRCTEDGTWSTPPICHEVNCGAPPTVENSDKQVFGYSYNDTVRYECDVGYTLEGDSTILCQVIGHWTNPPLCVELPCGDPPEIENTKGFPIVTGTTVGAEAKYSCKTGYVMSGEPVIICQTNQQWSTSPQCNRIRCGEPPDVQNALKSVGGHYLNDSTEYECHIGYVRIGNELIFCQTDGHWTVAPTCAVLSCGVPPTPKNSGLVSLGGTGFGETATYQCLTGFSTDDPKYITCQLNGTWSRAPNCTEGSSKDSDKASVLSSVNNQKDNKSAAKSQNLSSSSTTLIICMSLLSIVVIALVIVGAFCYLSKRKTSFTPTSVTNATYEEGDFGETDAVL